MLCVLAACSFIFQGCQDDDDDIPALQSRTRRSRQQRRWAKRSCPADLSLRACLVDTKDVLCVLWAERARNLQKAAVAYCIVSGESDNYHRDGYYQHHGGGIGIAVTALARTAVLNLSICTVVEAFLPQCAEDMLSLFRESLAAFEDVAKGNREKERSTGGSLPEAWAQLFLNMGASPRFVLGADQALLALVLTMRRRPKLQARKERREAAAVDMCMYERFLIMSVKTAEELAAALSSVPLARPDVVANDAGTRARSGSSSPCQDRRCCFAL